MYNSQEEFVILHDLGIGGKARRCPTITPVIWNFPPRNWIKVNIDGAAKGSPGHAGCGGIFRNCRGFSKGCFAKYLGIKFAFEAEILGFITAIEIAKKFNWSPLWIESDSAYVVTLFSTNSFNVPWEIRNRWSKALSDAKSLNVHVSHIYREGNCVADKLASLSSIPDTNRWWFNPPEFLASSLYRDMVPLPFYRFRN